MPQLVTTTVQHGVAVIRIDNPPVNALSREVIDINGCGFLAFRGGPMSFADRLGLAHVYDRVASFHRDLGAPRSGARDTGRQ